jgi:AraC-like DNA-binding protein
MPATRLVYVTQANDDARLGRWRYSSATPVGPLAAYVECFWGTESFGTYSRETILPRAVTEVFFNLGPTAKLLRNESVQLFRDAWISGLHERPFEIENDPYARLVSIRLRPEGVLPFLGFPPSEVAGRVLKLSDCLGPDVEPLRETLREARDLECRLALLARYAERRFARSCVVSNAVRGSIDELRRRPEARIRDLVEESGWSHRHFIGRFRGEIGLAPKAFARVVRFERAVAGIQAARRIHWATLALDSGYADQSHMVNEFRDLAGTTPTDLARRLAPDRTGLIPAELA